METEFQPLVRIIDDDEAFRDSHEMFFRLEGWDVESFADASSFLEKASTKRPGCILLDIRMPGLSGPQLQEGERQKFCVHGIIGARQTGASNEHEHQTQFS